MFGALPFKGACPIDISASIRTQPLHFPEEPSVSDLLKDLLSRLLDKNPQTRATMQVWNRQGEQGMMFDEADIETSPLVVCPCLGAYSEAEHRFSISFDRHTVKHHPKQKEKHADVAQPAMCLCLQNRCFTLVLRMQLVSILSLSKVHNGLESPSRGQFKLAGGLCSNLHANPSDMTQSLRKSLSLSHTNNC